MRTISTHEFSANPDLYLDMACEQDVYIQKGQQVFHLTCEPPIPPQPFLEPDDDFRRAITIDEFKKRMRVSIHKFFADK